MASCTWEYLIPQQPAWGRVTAQNESLRAGPGEARSHLATSPLGWGRGSIFDGLAFGNVSLRHFGCEAAAAVGAGDIVWVLYWGQWGQVRELSPSGQHLLHLAGLAQGPDEILMLLSPVVCLRWLILQGRR